MSSRPGSGLKGVLNTHSSEADFSLGANDDSKCKTTHTTETSTMQAPPSSPELGHQQPLLHPRIEALSHLPLPPRRKRPLEPADHFYTFSVYHDSSCIFFEQGLPDGTDTQTSTFDCQGDNHNCMSRLVYPHKWTTVNRNIWWRCRICGDLYIIQLQPPMLSFPSQLAALPKQPPVKKRMSPQERCVENKRRKQDRLLRNIAKLAKSLLDKNDKRLLVPFVPHFQPWIPIRASLLRLIELSRHMPKHRRALPQGLLHALRQALLTLEDVLWNGQLLQNPVFQPLCWHWKSGPRPLLVILPPKLPMARILSRLTKRIIRSTTQATSVASLGEPMRQPGTTY